MFNPTHLMIRSCIKRLQAGYRQTYGTLKPAYADLIGQVAELALDTIARSDAPYHNVEHTILVSLVGQTILRGKQLQTGDVSCEDWLHFMVSLLCHDIGYVRGICQQDQVTARLYATGMQDEQVAIAPGATDASLTSYHVDRGKQFIMETFEQHPLLDLDVIQHNIEFTRFPVPQDAAHQATDTYAGLTRAADLIGQLSDPRYLEKLPALFYEFEETGTNKAMGYRHPGDLRASYPKFFRNVVCPYIQDAVRYLRMTRQGRQILANLYANVRQVEQEQEGEPGDRPTLSASPACSALNQFRKLAWGEVTNLIHPTRLASERC